MNNVYKLHVRIIKTGGLYDTASLRHLLLSCTAAAPQALPHARSLFLRIPSPDTFFYNTIIRAHAHHSPRDALSFFSRMRDAHVPLDNFTFPFVIKAFARLQIMGYGLHSLIIKLGFVSDMYVQNALINAYGCVGSVEFALKVFDEMRGRDVVSWSSMISCYVNNGFEGEALSLFQQMQVMGKVEPDEVTMLSVISAISGLGSLELGRWVDSYIRHHGFVLTVSLGTALIDMFSRYGSIEESVRVFNEMPERNIMSWTAIINGLAVHGRAREALRMFDEMKKSGLQPDHITFSAVLVACSHGGLVEDGWRIFESIKREYDMEPLLEHHGCIVDILGRAGKLHQAYEFVEKMPIRPNSVVWRTLLGACVNHKDVELAEKVRERINELDPHHDGDYVLLSNAYGEVGRWSEKAHTRDSMKDRRISKTPGCSLISVDQEIHEFISGDNSNQDLKGIREFLESVTDKLKVRGYVPLTSNVLHDIEDEEKESSLGYHSEKLAVAFGLLSFQDKRTIRVMKNLRICRDCHSFMKHVSCMFDREIIIRDRNRFHHFSRGSCSCNDYW